MKPPSGSRPHEHIRHDRLHQRRSEGEARLRVETANFADHVGQILVAHAADLAQRHEVALRQQIEVTDQRLHGGIETIELAELDGEAFGQIARAHAGRIEALQDREHGFRLGGRRAELVGDLRQIAGEIAGLVDQVDDVLPDHPADRIGDRKRKLFGEMAGERGLRRDEGFEIVVAVVAAARPAAAPV